MFPDLNRTREEGGWEGWSIRFILSLYTFDCSFSLSKSQAVSHSSYNHNSQQNESPDSSLSVSGDSGVKRYFHNWFWIDLRREEWEKINESEWLTTRIERTDSKERKAAHTKYSLPFSSYPSLSIPLLVSLSWSCPLLSFPDLKVSPLVLPSWYLYFYALCCMWLLLLWTFALLSFFFPSSSLYKRRRANMSRNRTKEGP